MIEDLNLNDKIYLSPYNAMTKALEEYLKETYSIRIEGFIDSSKTGENIHKPNQITQLLIDKIIILSPNYDIEIFDTLIQYIVSDRILIANSDFQIIHKFSFFIKRTIKKMENFYFSFFSFVFSLLKIKISILWTNRIGEFVLANEALLRKLQLKILPENQRYLLLFIGKKKDIANKTLYEMYKRTFRDHPNLYLIESKLLLNLLQSLLKNPSFHNSHYFNMKTQSNEYDLFTRTKSSIKFTEAELQKGELLLKKLQICKPYVCIFSRDSAYLKKEFPSANWNYHNYRDADIDSYQLAAKYLIEKGYTVVRIGSIVEKPFVFNHEKCIDYPYTKYTSDFMDIFLIAQCEAVIGSNSGATDVANAFGVTKIGTNHIPINYAPFSTKQDLFIPKKLKKNDKYISLSQYLTLSNKEQMLRGETYSKLQIKIEDNTPEEIRDICKEFLERNSYNSHHHLYKKYYKIHSKSEEMGKIKTKIGSQFLLNNRWYIDEMDIDK